MWPGREKLSAVEKELKKVEREEAKFIKNACKQKTADNWRVKLEKKIPDKTMTALQKAFSKAFYIVYEKGTGVIEKTYDAETLRKEFQINDYAMDVKGGKKEIRRIRSGAAGGNALNMAITTVEGVGLGVLGIGLPDIVIWVGMLLKGVYETALKYGYTYDSPVEKMFILQMIEIAMLSGTEQIQKHEDLTVPSFACDRDDPDEKELKEQIEKTAHAFATEMLVTKAIQGIPIVGVIGGAANPVYYHKILKYVQLQYRKRYLTEKAHTVVFPDNGCPGRGAGKH